MGLPSWYEIMMCSRLRLRALLGAYLVAGRAFALPLAPNMVRLDQVCFEADRGRLRLAVYDTAGGNGSSVSQLCASLTRCENSWVHEACARGTTATELVRRSADVMHVVDVVDRAGEAYPPAGAARRGTGAMVSFGESPTHNLHSSLASVFEQRLALEGAGETLDVVIERVFRSMWVEGASSREGLASALREPTRDWTLGVAAAALDGVEVLAMTRCNHTSPWGSCDDAVIPAAMSVVRAAPLCVDALFVAVQLFTALGFPIHASTGDALAELRERTKRYYGVEPRRAAGAKPAPKVVTLFTRGDAQFRKLVGLQGRMREEMGITRVVDTLVLPLADQVRLFDEADVFIAPHGNNNINSLWMRPGTLYVEIRPWCAEMCVLGCDTRFAHSEVGRNATFLDLFGSRPRRSASGTGRGSIACLKFRQSAARGAFLWPARVWLREQGAPAPALSHGALRRRGGFGASPRLDARGVGGAWLRARTAEAAVSCAYPDGGSSRTGRTLGRRRRARARFRPVAASGA